MNTVAHLVRHDLRALRLPIAAWCALLLAQAVMMAAGPGLLEADGRNALTVGFAEFLAGARLAFTMLLTVLIVQRDSPVGTTAFWLTRPIPPAALAAGKLCSAALVVVALPAAVGWGLFSVLGLPGPDLNEGITQLVLEQSMLVSLSAMGAAITASIAHFAVAALAAVLLVGTLANQARPVVTRLPVEWSPVSWSPFAVWTAVSVAGAAAVLAFQYARRRTVPAAAAAAGVLVIGTLSALTAPATFEPRPAAPLRAGSLDTGAVTLAVDPPELRIESGATRNNEGRLAQYRYATAVLRTAGVPPAIMLQPSSIDAVWHPEGASPIRWQGRRAAVRTTVQREAEADGQPFLSISRGLGGVELPKPARSEHSAFRTTLLSLPDERLSGLSPARGPLDATVTLRAWRYRVVESVPLVAGRSLAAREGRLTVRGIARNREGVHVDVHHAFLRRMFWTAEDAFGSGGVGSAERIVLRNRSRRQAVPLAGFSGGQLRYSFANGLSNAQLGTGAQRLRFVIPIDAGNRATLDEEWLKDAELVVLRPEDLGAFTKTLRVESVNLADAK